MLVQIDGTPYDWLNSFYKHYLNKKFVYLPLDTIDEFVPVEEDFDYIEKLSIAEKRTIQNGNHFSYELRLFSLVDEGIGEIVHITKALKSKYSMTTII